MVADHFKEKQNVDKMVDKEYEKYQAEHHEITKVDEDYFKALSSGIKHLEGDKNER